MTVVARGVRGGVGLQEAEMQRYLDRYNENNFGGEGVGPCPVWRLRAEG
jgi:hypothetical protein